ALHRARRLGAPVVVALRAPPGSEALALPAVERGAHGGAADVQHEEALTRRGGAAREGTAPRVGLRRLLHVNRATIYTRAARRPAERPGRARGGRKKRAPHGGGALARRMLGRAVSARPAWSRCPVRPGGSRPPRGELPHAPGAGRPPRSRSRRP